MHLSSLTSRLLLLSTAVVLGSCATSTPSARFSQPLSAIVTAEDGVHATVQSAPPTMSETDRLRLAAKVTTYTRSMALSAGAKGEAYELVLDVTRYDHGNAAVRAFIPGGGQIHLDGIVTVLQMPGRVRVGEFAISKTFAWTGMYALVTSMDTIENTFARAVAETVTGRK